MNGRRMAKGLASIVAAAAVVVAVPALVFLLAAEMPPTYEDDLRAAEEVKERVRRLVERGRGRLPMPAQDDGPGWARRDNPFRMDTDSGLDWTANPSPEDSILTEQTHFAQGWGYAARYFLWRPSGAGTKSFFHGFDFDRAGTLSALRRNIPDRMDAGNGGTYTLMTPALHQRLDEWEETILDPMAPIGQQSSREALTQLVIMRAYHRGDRERARWLFFGYFRVAAGRHAGFYGTSSGDVDWPKRIEFLLLMDSQGFLDAGTLAALEQAIEPAILTDEEHLLLRLGVDLFGIDCRPQADTPYLMGMLTEPAVARVLAAVIHGEDRERPWQAQTLVDILDGPRNDGAAYPRSIENETPELLGTMPWLMDIRAERSRDVDNLRFVLAALRFRQEHGRLPAGDEDLVPGYLPADFCARTFSRWLVDESPEVDATELIDPPAALLDFRRRDGRRYEQDQPQTIAIPAWRSSWCVEAEPVFIRITDRTTIEINDGQRSRGTVDPKYARSRIERDSIAAAAKTGPKQGTASATFLQLPWRWELVVRALEGIPAPPPAPTPTPTYDGW